MVRFYMDGVVSSFEDLGWLKTLLKSKVLAVNGASSAVGISSVNVSTATQQSIQVPHDQRFQRRKPARVP